MSQGPTASLWRAWRWQRWLTLAENSAFSEVLQPSHLSLVPGLQLFLPPAKGDESLFKCLQGGPLIITICFKLVLVCPEPVICSRQSINGIQQQPPISSVPVSPISPISLNARNMAPVSASPSRFILPQFSTGDSFSNCCARQGSSVPFTLGPHSQLNRKWSTSRIASQNLLLGKLSGTHCLRPGALETKPETKFRCVWFIKEVLREWRKQHRVRCGPGEKNLGLIHRGAQKEIAAKAAQPPKTTDQPYIPWYQSGNIYPDTNQEILGCKAPQGWGWGGVGCGRAILWRSGATVNYYKPHMPQLGDGCTTQVKGIWGVTYSVYCHRESIFEMFENVAYSWVYIYLCLLKPNLAV